MLTNVSTVDQVSRKSHLPGKPGIWVPLTIDVITFLGFFIFFTIGRNENLALYEQSRQQLDVHIGLAVTLVLLTSSWFVIRALEAARKRIPAEVKSNLQLAILLAFAFIVLKGVGWTEDVLAGNYITTNDFFQYYFCITAYHFLHVLAGTVFLIMCLVKAQSAPVDGDYVEWLESAGCFWHVVDMLWVFIFPLLFLLRVV
jgi:nitric oxide reductase NorE protein